MGARNGAVTTTVPPSWTVIPMERRDERRSSKRNGPSSNRSSPNPTETGGVTAKGRPGQRSWIGSAAIRGSATVGSTRRERSTSYPWGSRSNQPPTGLIPSLRPDSGHRGAMTSPFGPGAARPSRRIRVRGNLARGGPGSLSSVGSGRQSTRGRTEPAPRVVSSGVLLSNPPTVGGTGS